MGHVAGVSGVLRQHHLEELRASCAIDRQHRLLRRAVESDAQVVGTRAGCGHLPEKRVRDLGLELDSEYPVRVLVVPAEVAVVELVRVSQDLQAAIGELQGAADLRLGLRAKCDRYIALGMSGDRSEVNADRIGNMHIEVEVEAFDERVLWLRWAKIGAGGRVQ